MCIVLDVKSRVGCGVFDEIYMINLRQKLGGARIIFVVKQCVKQNSVVEYRLNFVKH